MRALTALLALTEGIKVEPSATAGLLLPWLVAAAPGFRTGSDLSAEQWANATHLLCVTGGVMVLQEEMDTYLAQGQ